MTTATRYVLKHRDGTKVMAQEAYNAYMNGSVVVTIDGSEYHNATGMGWVDANGASLDSSSVKYVELYNSSNVIFKAGTDPRETAQ